MDLGKVGVWTFYRALGEDNAGAAASLAERLGFGALWIGGSPRLPNMRPLLEASERLVVATGIVNIWHYEPEQLAAEFAELDADFPGRLLVGIGIGHPENTDEYARPLATTRAFLDRLDRAPAQLPADRRCLAALAPRMLALSAERSLGTHPYFTAVAHTRTARMAVGPGALVAPELACVLDEDRERGRATARAYAEHYLGLRNYRNALLAHGFDESDCVDGGSERLIDEVVPQGSVSKIAAVVRRHFDAGADHVCLQSLGEPAVPIQAWSALAAELIS